MLGVMGNRDMRGRSLRGAKRPGNLVVSFKRKNPPLSLRERMGVRGSASAHTMTLLPPAGVTPLPGSLRFATLSRDGERVSSVGFQSLVFLDRHAASRRLAMTVRHGSAFTDTSC